MKTNVFWTIVITILVAWIGLMAFVIFSKGGEASKAESSLRSKVSKMGGYANMDAAELPTEDLVVAKRAFLANQERELEAAKRVFQDRDAKFEMVPTRKLDEWQAINEDRYNRLEEKYREYAELPGDEKTPFPKFDLRANEIIPAEKAWKAMEFVVNAVMDRNGRIVDYKPQSKIQMMPALPDFDRSRYEVRADLPPSAVPGLTEALLGHPYINFEVNELIIGKVRENLKNRLVERIEGEGQPSPEPRVRVLITLDVLDWNPKPEAAPQEQG